STLLKLAFARFNHLHATFRLAPRAVSVDAHYREPELLRKGFLKENFGFRRVRLFCELNE
ncbi:hypothetical protein KJI95_17025, partial [Shewanella sp. JM162201]